MLVVIKATGGRGETAFLDARDIVSINVEDPGETVNSSNPWVFTVSVDMGHRGYAISVHSATKEEALKKQAEYKYEAVEIISAKLSNCTSAMTRDLNRLAK